MDGRKMEGKIYKIIVKENNWEIGNKKKINVSNDAIKTNRNKEDVCKRALINIGL